MTECEADGEHQQGCDFVGSEGIECAFAHVEIGERVGLLDGDSEAVSEYLGEAWDARPAAGEVYGADLGRVC